MKRFTTAIFAVLVFGSFCANLVAQDWIRTGTGLGIPFALKVSEVHDGGLRYQVRAAGGTEALFWIPCP